MARAFKNFWSLNTDEAVVTGILRDECGRGIETLMPLSAQMKDVDLVVLNPKNKKLLLIQVKGSRAFEPKEEESTKYGDGNIGWFFISKDIIHRSTADYFIFLVYVLEQSPIQGRRTIRPHTLTIPTNKLKTLVKKNKRVHGGRYSFYFWVNPKAKKALDIRDKKYFVSEFLDKKGLARISNQLS